ncbi:SAG-related sequence [Besnoitia besnoiti]|uniref:SAG-related sequence n=1 Tax=Besnoitia besnoiti TaxID=94643 RepID=A0A2A9MHD5_BESBE|nr:SAG-related sequence [Besnoitia besnoiti]PFH37948.1 SAG-related sequence [Besnoitia besnoiti]
MIRGRCILSLTIALAAFFISAEASQPLSLYLTSSDEEVGPADENHTCSDTNDSVTIVLEPNDTDAVFECSDPYSTLAPKDCTGDEGTCPTKKRRETHEGEKPTICEDQDCNTVKHLTDIFPDAQRKRHSNGKRFKLFIPKREANYSTSVTTKDVWYHCEKRDSGQTPCKVKISVQSPSPVPQLPPDPAQNKCEKDGQIVKLEASPELPLTFECGADRTLQPSGAELVHDDSDGNCRNPVKLSTLVDAHLDGPPVAVSKVGRKKYTLTVQQLPPKKAFLCYRCAAQKEELTLRRLSEVKEKDCFVKITVQADPQATTPAPPATSSSATAPGRVITVASYAFLLVAGTLARG